MVRFTGGCLCGQIRYTLAASPEFPHFCTCHMCQKWTGAPVVAWADFPLAWTDWPGYPLLKGQTQQGVAMRQQRSRVPRGEDEPTSRGQP